MIRGHRITVGLDGSASSVRALAWAVGEGVRTGRPVGVLTAWPLHAAVMVHEVPGHYSDARGRALEVQRHALRQAGVISGRPSVVSAHLVNTSPVEALLAASLTAGMIVVGSHDPQDAGPVARRCWEESSCAVSVVGPLAARRREDRVTPAAPRA